MISGCEGEILGNKYRTVGGSRRCRGQKGDDDRGFIPPTLPHKAEWIGEDSRGSCKYSSRPGRKKPEREKMELGVM